MNPRSLRIPSTFPQLRHRCDLPWTSVLTALPLLALVLSLTGCETLPRAVVAASGTNIGLEISQSPANQVPQAKLGYNRGEVALVNQNEFDGDVANVLMELNYSNILASNSGIYQRLAVGREAVRSTGAKVMMSKSKEGLLPTDQAIQDANEAHELFSDETFD